MNAVYLKIVVLGSAFLLTACKQDAVRFEDSPYALFPAGTTLIQHQDIILQANAFEVTIQNRQVINHNNLDWQDANCVLESTNSIDTSRVLKSGKYDVTSSKRHNEEVRLPVKVAGLMPVNGDEHKIIVLTLKLASSQNPFIVRMTCTDWGEYFDDQFLSLNQVRATLQPLFSIRLPGE